MASSHSKSKSVVSLSDLPDEVLITVLSLLPTCKAASTSVISCRFHHLWKASPSVDLSLLKSISRSSYVTMANSALLSRTRSSSNSLLRLHLDLGYPVSLYHLTDSLFCSLLVHAHALGLRHLTIDGNWDFVDFEPILCSVFSISSLESLSIYILPPITCPYTITLTRLKTLSINLVSYNSTQVQQLLSELCCLEDLHLRITYGFDVVCLSSQTIKKLNLLLLGAGATHYHEPDSLVLTMPSLELLCLTNLSFHADVPLIHGEIPLIRKAVLTLDCLCREHVTAVAQFLNFISHVEELSLDLKEKEHMEFDDYPFPVLLEPGKEVPTFPNLKHLDLSIRFHEFNFEALVMMLHHCTALESLQLHHKHLNLSIRFHEYNFEAVVTMLNRCTALESLQLHHKPFRHVGSKMGEKKCLFQKSSLRRE